MNELLLLASVAAFISLDTTAFGHFMIARPIVAGPLFGYLLGDVKTGLWLGMIVELIWVNAIPMGAAVPQDTTVMTVLALVWGLRTFPAQQGAMILALALAVPAGTLFKRIDIAQRYFNVRIAHWVEKGVTEGRENSIARGVVLGMSLFFLKAWVFYALLLYPGQWLLETVFLRLSPDVIEGLGFAWQLLPLAGMGLVLIAFHYDKFPGHRFRGGRQRGE